MRTHDENAFLFSVRPNIKSIQFQRGYEDGFGAMIRNIANGPTFGEGWDIYVRNAKHETTNIQSILTNGYPKTFDFVPKDVFGCSDQTNVLDFEVFQIIFD